MGPRKCFITRGMMCPNNGVHNSLYGKKRKVRKSHDDSPSENFVRFGNREIDAKMKNPDLKVCQSVCEAD